MAARQPPSAMRACLLIAVVALLLASRAGAKKPRVDAAAAGGAGADIIVAKDGTGQYTTIQEAFTAARSGNRNRFFVIFIKAGIYEEQPTLPANLRFIGLVGERAGSGVKITSSGAAGDSSLDECATFRLLASDVVVSNIIFENAHGPGEQGGDEDQAVAMKVAGTRVAFYGCTFLGYQDTLYATIGLQYYKNCIIQGRVDFVFGNAKALFHDCKFRLVYWGGGYFAQARDKGQDTGFVVLGGSLKPFGKGPIKPGYLARSWGDYSTVVFVNTMFAAGSVRAEGWGFVSGYEDTDSLTFGAYGCYGPGYNTTGWESFAKVMTAAEAAPYSSIKYVNQGGWIVDPNALVRGVGGLVNNGNGKGGGRKKPAASPTPATTPSPKPVPTKPSSKPSSKPGPKPAPKTAPVPAPKTAPVPAPKTAPVPAPKASGSAPNKGTGNVPASSGGRGKKRGPVADGASGTPGGQTGGGKPVASVSPPAPKTNGNGRDRRKPAGVGGGSKKGNSSRGNGANGNKNKDDDGDDDDDN